MQLEYKLFTILLLIVIVAVLEIHAHLFCFTKLVCQDGIAVLAIKYQFNMEQQIQDNKIHV